LLKRKDKKINVFTKKKMQNKVILQVFTRSIPSSMNPKLFAGDTIASAAGASLKMSPAVI
jgi:hypothetical protein